MRDREAAINRGRLPTSLHLIFLNFSIRAFVLWYGDKIALKLWLPLSGPRRGSGRHLPQRFIMVRVRFLVYIYGASASGASRIETLALGIEGQVIDVLVDRKCLKFLAGLCIEYNDLSSAAAHKKAMVGFI